MISDLRNSNLKLRHWQQINELLQINLTAENHFTIAMLEDIKAFDYYDAVHEISEQASSEATLEAMLKKVRLSVT